MVVWAGRQETQWEDVSGCKMTHCNQCPFGGGGWIPKKNPSWKWILNHQFRWIVVFYSMKRREVCKDRNTAKMFSKGWSCFKTTLSMVKNGQKKLIDTNTKAELTNSWNECLLIKHLLPSFPHCQYHHCVLEKDLVCLNGSNVLDDY